MDIGLVVRDRNGNLLRVSDKVAYGLMTGNTYALTEIGGVTRDRIAGARVDITETAVIVTLNLREPS
jgi:hypothetical protein